MMKCISLWQPYATAVAVGIKAFETRHWRLKARGELAIQAAQRFSADEKAAWAGYVQKYGFPAEPPLGAIVAVVDVGCPIPTADLQHLSMMEKQWGDYGPNRYGWPLTNVRALRDPVPCKGYQNVWTLDEEIEAAVRAQL